MEINWTGTKRPGSVFWICQYCAVLLWANLFSYLCSFLFSGNCILSQRLSGEIPSQSFTSSGFTLDRKILQRAKTWLLGIIGSSGPCEKWEFYSIFPSCFFIWLLPSCLWRTLPYGIWCWQLLIGRVFAFGVHQDVLCSASGHRQPGIWPLQMEKIGRVST